MLYRFWKGFGFKPHCAIVYLPFFVHPHGSIRSFGARKTSARERGQVCQALEALVQEREEVNEEREEDDVERDEEVKDGERRGKKRRRRRRESSEEDEEYLSRRADHYLKRLHRSRARRESRENRDG